MVMSPNGQYSPQFMGCSKDGNLLDFEDVDADISHLFCPEQNREAFVKIKAFERFIHFKLL